MGRYSGGAGALMAERGLDFDRCFTSYQTRAIKTLNLALEAMDRLWLPVEKHWRLNERHYGGLTGLNKAAIIAKAGEDQVKFWRRSFDVPPPQVETGSQYYPSLDRPYAGCGLPRPANHEVPPRSQVHRLMKQYF